MRIVRADEADRPEFHLVNGDRVEAIAEYESSEAATRAMEREASRASGESFKIVLNADPSELVGNVIA